ncbi:MAG: carbon-nitrogen hydrolase family protein [Alphaproteobacteria bacterium]|nr:MAG: carbon-nitrogen hydrolase family protein [Alphaproteobacteria bacterium]TAF39360.1 MAG: carbon-nitrogen hydrolase family protein [Alphaproteobacteria bacterium]TAF75670.1 MAG: carbon-nitrogen hydrolase family protein [Alphaproteobacteria bacterium]
MTEPSATSHVRVACIQLTSINDEAHNIALLSRMVEEAVTQGAQLIATPENSFYMRASDRDHVPLAAMHVHAGVLAMQALAIRHGVWILIGSLFVPSTEPPLQGGRWFNRSVMIDPQGRIACHYDKIHLFDASFDEHTHYRESARICPGNQVGIVTTPWGKIGMTICYDVRFPHLYRDLAKHGVEMIAVPAAFAEITGRAHWHVLLRARAIENGAYVLAPAQCGVHPGNKRTYGHAMIVNPWGEIIAEAGDEPTIIYATLDRAHVQRVRTNLPTLQHDRHYFAPPEYMI